MSRRLTRKPPLHAVVRPVDDVQQPLVRLAQGLARQAGARPELLARELAELTGAGYTAVFLRGDDGLVELRAAAGDGAPTIEAGALAQRALETVTLDQGAVAAPLVSDGATLGAIVAMPAGSPLRIDEELVQAVADLAASVFAADSRIAASRAEARRDAVTGLGNRLAFDERLARAVESATASRRVALLVLDADGFKRVNDTRGHAAGDEVLRELARVLSRCVRPQDAVFRLGGDEFAVVLAGGRDAAVRVGIRIRSALRAHRRAELPTLSGGIATAPDDARTPTELARAADAALYAAKGAGRDRILVYEGEHTFAAIAASTAEADRALRALVAEDDPAFRELVRTVLEGAGVEVEEARSGREARARVAGGPPDVVVLDLGLPDEDGLTLCRDLKSVWPSLPVAILTGREATAAEGAAVSAGADAFLRKPFGPLELIDLVEALAAGRSQRRPAPSSDRAGGAPQTLLLARDLRSLLEIERGQRLLLQRAYRQTVTALAAALETKDTGTEAHSKRVQRYALRLAAAVDPLLVDDPSIEYGFLLHDVGKIGIPDRVLLKPGPLTASERRLIETHTVLGEQLLAGVEILQGAGLQIVRSHHERWDGSGYPDGLSGRAIPLAARVFAVADSLDAMTSDRPYRETGTWHDAVDEIERNAGTQFDPAVVDAFAGCTPALREIYVALAA
ncbi:MAG TPA: diguanylate cyclase [Gaiellaceae bacterium]